MRSLIRFLSVIVFLAVLTDEVRAEQRIFELVITEVESGRARTALSTLDEIQYPMYHHVRKNEVVSVRDSWMCYRRSDHFTRPCPNPRAPAGEAPAAPPGAAPPTASSQP